ncbi:unnamed protein product [Discula destructiva]
MSGHAGHQLRLTALRSRTRPQLRPQYGKYLQHEFAPRIAPQAGLAGQRRPFSVADGASGLLRCSEWLITNTHDITGAPWSVSIPLAALIVSAAVRAPLSLYSHQKARKRAKLGPLIQAQTAMIGLGLRKKAVPDLRKKVVEVMKKRSKKLAETFAGSERGSIIGGLLTLPIFVSNLEVIRRMCGGPRGLFGRLVFGASGADGPADPATAAATMSAEGISASTPFAADMAEAAVASHRDVISDISVEPTFATEGCLWFPNLLESDPLHILPFALSAILVAHMIPGTSAARRELIGLSPVAGDKHAVMMGQTGKRRALQRTMLILAFAMGPITMDMPAALHLYWLSSAGFSLAVTKGLRRALPIPKNTVRPCQGMEMPLLRPKPVV